MSLSPFDSFQSRFVTYLLNFPSMFNKYNMTLSLVWQSRINGLIIYNHIYVINLERKYICKKKRHLLMLSNIGP